jgi:hypothetical protein
MLVLSCLIAIGICHGLYEGYIKDYVDHQMEEEICFNMGLSDEEHQKLKG